MKKVLFTSLVGILLLSGCSTMTPARYSVSADNNQALKQYQGKVANLSNFSSATTFDASCRMMGPIEAADGLSVQAFIQKAFNEEFKLAGIHGANGAQITGTLTHVEFSSTAGLTGGWWKIGVTLQSSNKKTLDVHNVYEFKSGFDAITACNQTAQALTPAVQDLIKKAVTDPRFVELL